MRAVLLERVQPLVERFAEQLADLLVADVERRVAQLGEAFEVALSTFAAELAVPDVRDAGSLSPGLAVPEAAVVAEQVSTSSARASLETRDRKALQRQPEPRVQAPASGPGKRKSNSCRKCGAVGFTSVTCGKTHDVGGETKPAAAIATPSLVTPPPTRSDRSAFIAERAAQREAAKRERELRAESFIRRDGPSRGAPSPVEPDELEEEPRVATLPEALASFDL